MGVMEIRMCALVCSIEHALGTNTCTLFSVDTTVQTQICEYYMRRLKKAPCVTFACQTTDLIHLQAKEVLIGALYMMVYFQ